MRRAAVSVVCAAGLFLATGAPAFAAPSGDHASCEAILTLSDAPNQYRDDVAREFAAEDFPPGDIYSVAARATGTTVEQCEAVFGPGGA